MFGQNLIEKDFENALKYVTIRPVVLNISKVIPTQVSHFWKSFSLVYELFLKEYHFLAQFLSRKIKIFQTFEKAWSWIKSSLLKREHIHKNLSKITFVLIFNVNHCKTRGDPGLNHWNYTGIIIIQEPEVNRSASEHVRIITKISNFGQLIMNWKISQWHYL